MSLLAATAEGAQDKGGVSHGASMAQCGTLMSGSARVW